jgi:hypothetical protein
VPQSNNLLHQLISLIWHCTKSQYHMLHTVRANVHNTLSASLHQVSVDTASSDTKRLCFNPSANI